MRRVSVNLIVSPPLIFDNIKKTIVSPPFDNNKKTIVSPPFDNNKKTMKTTTTAKAPLKRLDCIHEHRKYRDRCIILIQVHLTADWHCHTKTATDSDWRGFYNAQNRVWIPVSHFKKVTCIGLSHSSAFALKEARPSLFHNCSSKHFTITRIHVP